MREHSTVVSRDNYLVFYKSSHPKLRLEGNRGNFSAERTEAQDVIDERATSQIMSMNSTTLLHFERMEVPTVGTENYARDDVYVLSSVGGAIMNL